MRATRTFLAAALAVLALLPLLPATASAQSDPYYIGLSQTFSHEDNLIRLRDGQQTPAGLTKADTQSSTALVAGINQNFGRQRLSGSGSVRSNRYSNNSAFNNQGYSLNLGLQWETIESLSGSVSVAADRSLRADLRDRNGNFITGGNSETSRDLDLRARYGLFGPWSLTAGAAWRKDRFSSDQSSFRDYDQSSGNAGVRWRPGAQTEFGLGLSQTRVDYPQLFANQVNPNDRRTTNNIDLSAVWTPSGISAINARLSRGRTSYDPFPDRNFSATTGALEWNWQATGRLRLDTRLARDIGQDSDRATTAFSRTTDTLRFAAEFGVSAKVTANAVASTYKRQIVGNGLFVSNVSGQDDGYGLSLSLRWIALRSLSFGCTAGYERRNASDNAVLSDAYKGNAVSCFGQFVLQ